MRRQRKNRLFPVVLIGFLAVGCHWGDTKTKTILNLFTHHGFVFVWEVQSQNGNLDDDALRQPHAANEQTLPSRLDEGKAYVFHPVQQIDFEELGTQNLPRWIEESGCSIVNAPKSTDDMIFPYDGGPEFDIDFRCGRRTYRIGARSDPYVGMLPGRRKNSPALILILRK